MKNLQPTKQDLSELEKRINFSILSFKDEILHEIKGLREEIALVIGYKDQIEDHEVRIEALEKVA